MFFDLNGFKPINDSFGHAEGDGALVAFAEQMRNTSRDPDVHARPGGDEFVVFLTSTSNQVAQATIERFRQSIDRYNKQAARGYDIRFSEGIVTVDVGQHRSMEELLSSADKLMYKKKRAVA